MGRLLNLLPLVVLFLVVGVGAFVGYQIYLWTNEMADRGKHHMEKKNVSFTKDGMKVGVREINDEEYTDKTQNYLVKAWNYSSFPAYKSRFWNTEAQGASTSRSTTKPKATSHPSAKSGSSSASGLSVPRGTTQRSVSPGTFPQ